MLLSEYNKNDFTQGVVELLHLRQVQLLHLTDVVWREAGGEVAGALSRNLSQPRAQRV